RRLPVIVRVSHPLAPEFARDSRKKLKRPFPHRSSSATIHIRHNAVETVAGGAVGRRLGQRMYEPTRLGKTLARLAAIGLCVSALATFAPADAPPAANLKDAYRDLQLTVHVRRALREEEALAAVNVGVRVRDGVAILWGPVPSAEVIAKALARIEKVQGILGV